MKKILKGIITSILLSHIIFLMIPFNIHAENVGGSSPVIGVNIYVSDYEYSKIPVQATVSFETDQTRWQCMSSHSTMGCQVWQSQNTSGTVQNDITGRISYSSTGTVEGYLYEYDFVFDKGYVGSVTFTSGMIGGTTTSTYFVNGSHLYLTSTSLITSFSISSYNLRALPDSIQYLNFPMESMNFVSNCFINGEIDDFMDVGQWKYPNFKFEANDLIFRYWTADKTLIVIFYSNLNLYSTGIDNTFDITYGTVESFTSLQLGNQSYLFKLFIKPTQANVTMQFKAKREIYITPIFLNWDDTANISTDFALQFGLTNRLLDDLNIIANGTTQSIQSASDLQQSTDNMQDQMDDMVDIESGYNQQFNNSLNNIDFTNPIQNNAGILPAANFVITVFNGLVNNPLSILIIIICILTIGKKVIGK